MLFMVMYPCHKEQAAKLVRREVPDQLVACSPAPDEAPAKGMRCATMVWL
ncbi:hypothetical protein [Paenibacillus elgii]|nr:hypothetical protein [Paenibacillus elgii]